MTPFVAILELERPSADERAVRRALRCATALRAGGVPGMHATHADGPFACAWFAPSEGRGAGWHPGFARDPRGARALVGELRLDRRAELAARLGLAERAGALGDAELALRLHERLGDAAVSELLGDFAFVLWDPRARSLFAARDPLGTATLYRLERPTWCALSNDPLPLLALCPDAREPDADSVLDFLEGDSRSCERTFFRGVARLPPGHTLRRSGATDARPTRYFFPPAEPLELPDARAYAERFRALLEDAVADRLPTDRAALLHLSGGLDSSSIVLTADALCRRRPGAAEPVVVSAVYPGLACDESPLIAHVRGATRLRAEQWDGTVGAPFDTEAELAEPCQDVLPAGDLDLAARLGTDTILPGFWGDELLFEDGAFRDLARRGRLLRLALETLPRRLYSSRTGAHFFSAALRHAVPPWVRGLYRSVRPRPAPPPPAWLGPALRARWAARELASDGEGASRALAFHSEAQRTSWQRLTDAQALFALERLRARAARRGVRYLFPFLDVRLVRFVLSMPSRHRLPGGRMKRVLRDAFADRMPRPVAERVAITGFDSAYLHLGRQHASRLRDVVSDRAWRSGAFVEQREACALAASLDGPDGRTADFERVVTVWNMASLETWLRRVATADFTDRGDGPNEH